MKVPKDTFSMIIISLEPKMNTLSYFLINECDIR